LRYTAFGVPPDHLPPLYVCLPGTGARWFCGGLLASLRLLDVAQEAGTGQLVTYTDRQPDAAFLPELLDGKSPGDAIFLVTWGYHVPDLLQRLAGRRVAYYAHSTGYGFDVPSTVAVLAGSRPALAYWADRAPRSPLYHLPPVLADEFADRGLERDIDVLAFVRKLSPYVREDLIPALAPRCRVSVVDGYVEDVAGLFNRARVYLYDSQPYWQAAGLSEGIGLQPLEALACGCRVFSSLNGGMAEYLDPAVNCGQIGVHSLEYDVARILEAVRAPRVPAPDVLRAYRRPSVRRQLVVLLGDLHRFFEFHGV
jgi:Glycosyl transferases group 1